MRKVSTGFFLERLASIGQRREVVSTQGGVHGAGRRSNFTAFSNRLLCFPPRQTRPNQSGWLAQAERDASFGEIVGGHLDADLVAHGEADEMFAHLAGNVGEDFVLIVVQRDLEHGTRQNRFDDAFQLNGLLYAHKLLLRPK